MKTLVAYYSRTGQTSLVAKEIARRFDADLDPILPQQSGDSWLSPLRSTLQAMAHAAPSIQRPGRDPGLYDLVVIGVPIWRVGLAPPVRSYVRKYRDRFKQVAFFCAEGGGIEMRGFAELSSLCGKRPVATLAVARKHMSVAANRSQLKEFVQSVRGDVEEL